MKETDAKMPPQLLAHLRRNRLAHTYLFTGPAGQEKNELAARFAQALNCERSQTRGLTPFEFCSCSSCRKIEKGNHPDVRWLGLDPKIRSIKIEEIRTVVHESFLKPFEGMWKVFIFQDAERLTTEASNALLKTLEEPPGHSIFILLVETKAHLLETIQSRGCEIRLPPRPESDPAQDPSIQILEEKGWDVFLERLRFESRPDLAPALEMLMRYLKIQSAEVWQKNPVKSEQYLKAFEAVYETQEALEANVNQKLALTHLEIQLHRHCPAAVTAFP